MWMWRSLKMENNFKRIQVLKLLNKLINKFPKLAPPPTTYDSHHHHWCSLNCKQLRVPIRGLGHALIWSNPLQNPCSNSQSTKKKINFHCPQPFQSPQRKSFLIWHLGVNLNKWMKMELVRKNQIKKNGYLRKTI